MERRRQFRSKSHWRGGQVMMEGPTLILTLPSLPRLLHQYFLLLRFLEGGRRRLRLWVVVWLVHALGWTLAMAVRKEGGREGGREAG
jgi:hypothetical protein